ncbi:fimbria/pilus outer membrane usher protein [Stenotrophomonas sp. SY1]|uniref:fimbria/pilus outer membrane usher protein n=1 Tax=Stenotrophomonas sp. SY1 TaxID=477235 RepID=UPI001E2B80A3|nr:fimbria/pilus outer membrane usher protein [Stenotrophomonas sp. SY1]
MNAPADSTATTPANRTAPAGQVLILETRINHEPHTRLARFIARDGALLTSLPSLHELGVRPAVMPDASGLIALHAVAGISVDYDASLQRLDLQVPVEMLDRPLTHIDLARQPVPRSDPAQRSPGVLLNYDLYGQRFAGAGSYSAFNELLLFGIGPGQWSNTMSSELQTGNAGTSIRNTRLDSRWQLDFPDNMLTLSIGDTISGALDWSRATRIGGIRLSRNFALQPYRITTPLASFAGEAVLPSTVDLYIDGIRQSSQQVLPGRFQLDAAPSINGAGQAQLVVTDINGQSRAMGFSLYASPRLLQAGLSDWSLELGTLRRDYGQRSFAYGDRPIASASLRHGLNDQLTVEAHAEASAGIAQAGAGMQMLLGQRGGVLSTSLAASEAGSFKGNQYGLGYQWAASWLTLAASTLRRSRGFRDVPAVLEQAALPRRTDQAYAGISTRAGQFGLSYVAQQLPDATPSRYASLNWSRSFRGNTLLSLSYNRNLESSRSDSAFVYWSLPLDRHTSIAASARHGLDGNSLSMEASRGVSSDLGGWGWRAQASAGEYRSTRAEVTRLGEHGQWSAGVERTNNNDADDSALLYASASGGVAWLGGYLQALRRVDDAFALVSTNGISNVPIQLENRPVGVTDARGYLLVTPLNAWQRNQLSIDPQHLPADMQINLTSIDVVPTSNSGIKVNFALHRTLALQFGVRDRHGKWLPAGSHMTLHANDSTPTPLSVGHEGKVYLLDPPAQARLHFGTGQSACSAAVPAAPAREGHFELADVTCR